MTEQEFISKIQLKLGLLLSKSARYNDDEKQYNVLSPTKIILFKMNVDFYHEEWHVSGLSCLNEKLWMIK